MAYKKYESYFDAGFGGSGEDGARTISSDVYLSDIKYPYTKTIDGLYTIVKYTTAGNNTLKVKKAGNVEVLVVGGGGGASGTTDGVWNSTGGGGAEVIHNSSYALTPQIYIITVGAGGAAGAISSGNPGLAGASSILGTITARGGGGGTVTQGGSSGNTTYAGGTSPNVSASGGGAGDAAAGTNGSGTTGGNGGNGTNSNIDGVSTYYGGGGRGYGTVTQGNTGLGGGQTNYGGGSNSRSASAETAGGNGIIIIRYLSTDDILDETEPKYMLQLTSLTIDNTKILTVGAASGPLPTGGGSLAIIGVQGTCTIHGSIVVEPTYHYDNQQDNSWYNWYDMTDGVHLGGGAGQSSGFFTGTASTFTGGTKGAPGTKISQADAVAKTGGWGDNIHHITKFNKNWFVNGGGGGCGGGSNHSPSGGTWGGTHGGGVLYIECGDLVFDGSMSCNGGNGMYTDYGPGFYQCAGGGGGVLIVRAAKITTNTGTITATAGNATGIGSLDAAYSGGEGFMDITTPMIKGPMPLKSPYSAWV